MALTWQCGSNRRLAYAGSLISFGQSGRPGTFSRARLHIVEDDRAMSSLRSVFVVRARWSRSYGCRWWNTCVGGARHNGVVPPNNVLIVLTSYQMSSGMWGSMLRDLLFLRTAACGTVARDVPFSSASAARRRRLAGGAEFLSSRPLSELDAVEMTGVELLSLADRRKALAARDGM